MKTNIMTKKKNNPRVRQLERDTFIKKNKGRTLKKKKEKKK